MALWADPRCLMDDTASHDGAGDEKAQHEVDRRSGCPSSDEIGNSLFVAPGGCRRFSWVAVTCWASPIAIPGNTSASRHHVGGNER